MYNERLTLHTASSTNQKPTIYRDLYENTGRGRGWTARNEQETRYVFFRMSIFSREDDNNGINTRTSQSYRTLINKSKKNSAIFIQSALWLAPAREPQRRVDENFNKCITMRNYQSVECTPYMRTCAYTFGVHAGGRWTRVSDLQLDAAFCGCKTMTHYSRF